MSSGDSRWVRQKVRPLYWILRILFRHLDLAIEPRIFSLQLPAILDVDQFVEEETKVNFGFGIPPDATCLA